MKISILLNLIPQRYVLGLMGFFATFTNYTIMVVLNIAITQMVPSLQTQGDPNTCATIKVNNTLLGQLEHKKETYDWNESTKGIILSAYFWGYIFTHIPGGMLAERFGGKHTLLFGILVASIITFITPWLTVTSNGDWRVVTALRFLIGFSQGPSHPAINSLLSKWVPLSERAKLGTLVFSGSLIGTIITNVVSGALMKATGNWSSCFYFFGTAGVIWCILWQLLCYSQPSTHPFITEKELEYLKTKIDSVSKKRQPTPWKAIWTSPPIWALVAAQLGHDWGFFTLLTDLPTYMSDVLKFSIVDNGIWNSIPYLVMWICSMFSGWLCDFLITRKYLKITFARKLFTIISSMGPSVFSMAASYSGCDKNLTVTMFTLAMAFKAPFYCGFKVNALDLAPNYAGIVMAVVNGMGAIAGGIAPFLAGALTENHTLLEWRIVFWMTFGCYTITTIIYCIWGTAEIQPWNDPEKYEMMKKYSNTSSNVAIDIKSTEKTEKL
uniref:Inorganic phosphate cotransporter n=1 Tax=Diabrotica virgifera virgifera TaxID=50390 RepID=A0A6P7F7L5_DIAVI